MAEVKIATLRGELPTYVATPSAEAPPARCWPARHRAGPATRRDPEGDPGAPEGAWRCHPRPGPQPSTSSKGCW
jgi:hypothetical protein